MKFVIVVCMRDICGVYAEMAENSFGKFLGELINRKRKSLGLTQLQLAEDAYGNSNKVRRISELENGIVANPYPKTIDPIIVTLGISEEELSECAVLSASKPDASLDRAYREAKHLIEEIAKQFEHSHPDASLNEFDEFLRSKASEWLELKKRISELDSIEGTVVELHTSANDALADGDFDQVDALLLQAEELQQEKRT